MISKNVGIQYFLFFLKLFVGCMLLFYLFTKIDWNNFLTNWKSISIPLFLVLLSISFFDRYLMGYKWNLLLRAKGVFIPTHKAVSLYTVSLLFGVFTPGNLGGDAWRVMKLSPLRGSSVVLSTVILERLLGIFALAFFVTFSLPVVFEILGDDYGANAGVTAVIVIGVITLFFLLLFGPFGKRITSALADKKNRWLQKISEFITILIDYKNNRKVVLLFFLLTMFEMCIYFLRDFFAAHTSGVSVNLTFIFMLMPIVALTLRLPVSIQGIGVQEGMFAYVFSFAGFSIEEGVLVSIVWRFADVIAVYLPACILFWWFPNTYNIGEDDSHESGHNCSQTLEGRYD
jgi:hypothetical protein